MGDDADAEAAGGIIITCLQTSDGIVASREGGCRLGNWGGRGGRGFGEKEGHRGLGREGVKSLPFVTNADPFQDRHPGRQRELPTLERTASTPTRGKFAPLLRDVRTHPKSRHSSMLERSVSEIIPPPQSRRSLFPGRGGGGRLNGDSGDEVRLATSSRPPRVCVFR